MSLHCLCSVCTAFICECVDLFKEKQTTSTNLLKFLRNFQGHIDTDQFMALEMKRFQRFLPDSLSLQGLIAAAFLTEKHVVSIEIDDMVFLRSLWKTVLNRVKIRSDADDTAKIGVAVNLHMGLEYSKFQNMLIEHGV